MAKANLVWKRSDDGHEVTLEMHVDGVPQAHIRYDAAGLESDIHILADARASMAEEVTPQLEFGMRLKAIGDPAWKTERYDQYGGVMLALRHPGFGWLSFLLPPHEARALGASLVTLGDQIEAKDEPGAT